MYSLNLRREDGRGSLLINSPSGDDTCNYLQMIQSEIPGLTPPRATALAGSWDDGGLWEDVLWLSQQFWGANDTDEALLAWHHLVLAVGNFKRQTGRRLRPSRLNNIPQAAAARRDRLSSPSGLRVERDSQQSWEGLESELVGAGLATTTTLLAALWPDEHFVFDWRVQAAADALRIHAGLKPSRTTQLEIEGGKRSVADLGDYAIVRSWLQSIDCTLVVLERALYRLSQRVPTVSGRSWPDYAKAVASELERVSE